MTRLAGVNLFAREVEGLARFYGDLLGFAEIEEYRNPGFRALTDGRVLVGINARDAAATLGLDAAADAAPTRILVNFEVDSPAEVDRLVTIAAAAGARVVREGHESYFGAYQAILLDPEGNALRILRMPRRDA